MARFSIARSVQLALVGLSLVLAGLAGFGIASLYGARQHYEDRISAAFASQADAANLLAASVVEEATLRTAHGPHAALALTRAQTAFEQALFQARQDAGGDGPSLTLIARTAAAEAVVRGALNSSTVRAVRNQILALADRQVSRRASARSQARSDSRDALIVILIGGGLALACVVGLISVLLARVREPLSDLVGAAHRLAAGDLRARARSSGPDELRTLAGAFNAMADDLGTALGRLEDERNRLDLTIRSLGDALLVVDGDGVVKAANPRAGELVPGLVPGVGVASARSTLPPLAEALAGEVVVESEGRTLAASAALLPSDETGTGAVWTIRDVTERARLERLKSEFVATASHELRSPLTSIKGFVELLSQTKRLDARQREFIDIVLVSTNRLVDLVNDLLDVARVEAGKVEIHARPTNLGELLREVAQLMTPRFAEKRQDVRIDIDDDLPDALVDPARLRQIVTNLATNAHLYTQPGGTIAFSLAGADGERVRLTVSDNGPGMDGEQLDRAFDRFYRGGSNEHVQGSGLGLAIVRSLVELHGGEIELDSSPGEGTRVSVLLPRAPAPELNQHKLALGGKRVLIVDDEPEIARLIEERLAPFGAECEIAINGEEALERLASEPFDAVTLDILMPGMSGFDVLRAIRADQDLARIPVVVVSVFSGQQALAGEWIVNKPIDSDELAEALGGAVLAARVRVLAICRPEIRPAVSGALEAIGVQHDWAATRAEAIISCEKHFYEVALLDAGLPEAADTARALRLKGRRRLRPSVVVFSAGDEAPGMAMLDAEPITLDDAGSTIASMLAG